MARVRFPVWEGQFFNFFFLVLYISQCIFCYFSCVLIQLNDKKIINSTTFILSLVPKQQHQAENKSPRFVCIIKYEVMSKSCQKIVNQSFGLFSLNLLYPACVSSAFYCCCCCFFIKVLLLFMLFHSFWSAPI